MPQIQSFEIRQRIFSLRGQGLSYRKVEKTLYKEGINISLTPIIRTIREFEYWDKKVKELAKK